MHGGIYGRVVPDVPRDRVRRVFDGSVCVMNSHDLAKLLLTLPDLPIATHANNHTYMSGNDASSHGPLKVGLLETYGGQHIVVGNMSRMRINKPNWFVSRMLHGEAPK
jgi:hypothetical protein